MRKRPTPPTIVPPSPRRGDAELKRRVIRRLAVPVIVVSGTFAAIAAPVASAVTPHQHFLITPNGPHNVGPDACPVGSDAPNQRGFDNFHENVHFGQPSENGGAEGAFQNPGNPVSLRPRPCGAPPPA